MLEDFHRESIAKLKQKRNVIPVGEGAAVREPQAYEPYRGVESVR